MKKRENLLNKQAKKNTGKWKNNYSREIKS